VPHCPAMEWTLRKTGFSAMPVAVRAQKELAEMLVLDIHEAVPEPCWAKAVPVQRHSSQEVVEELARPGEAAEDPRVSSHSSGLPAKHGAVVAREL